MADFKVGDRVQVTVVRESDFHALGVIGKIVEVIETDCNESLYFVQPDAPTVLKRPLFADELTLVLADSAPTADASLTFVQYATAEAEVYANLQQRRAAARARDADPRDAELARLRAQVETLTAALKPFGDVWERFDETADTDATFSEWLVRSADLSTLGNACARAYKLRSEL